MASPVNYGVPTTVDWLAGYLFAYQQVNAMKCKDPDIINAICSATGAGGGTCISWVDDPSTRTFPIPQNYYISQCTSSKDCKMGTCDIQHGVCTCTSDKDCAAQGMSCIQNPSQPTNLVCGFAPQNVTSGHCKFVTQQGCESQGELPYTCDCGTSGQGGGGISPFTCTSKPQSELTKSYTEWHPTAGTTGGIGGACVLGNFVLRQWCEQPCSRCPPDASGLGYTSGCSDQALVPKFYYDKTQSACYMTKDYCDAAGLDYNKSSCTTDADCPGPNNFCAQGADSSYCTGPDAECNESAGQKAGEFFIGRTLFALFKNGFACPSEGFYDFSKKEFKVTDQLKQKIAEKFKNVGDMACMKADPNFVKEKKKLKDNFGGKGIHLYLIKWKTDLVETGFLADEVEKVYPALVDKNKNICIKRKDIGKNNDLKRMFLTINSKSWMKDTLLGMKRN